MSRKMKNTIIIGLYCLILALSSCTHFVAPNINRGRIERVGPSGHGFQNPVWSPDGAKIAVTVQTVVQSWTSEIFVFDVLTGKGKSIMYTGNGSVMAISWSSDGNQILLASQNGGDWTEGLWTLDPDGKSPVEFLAEGYDGDWSPDGKNIAVFSHSDKGAHQDILLSIINLETGDKEVIFGGKASNVSGGGVAWSPNGKELIFNYGPSGARKLDLYLLDVATKEATKITENGENFNPSWGPDGNLIVYVNDSDKESDSSMFIVDKNNSCQQMLLSLDNLWGPSWSPNGKYIAFISHGDIYLLDLNKYPTYNTVCPKSLN